MVADRRQQPGTDPGHPVQPFEPPKGAPGLPVGRDDLGKVKTNPRKTGDLEGAGLVEVDPLPLRQGPGKGEPRVAVGGGAAPGRRREKGELAGRGVRHPVPEPERLAAKGQAQQQQYGPPFGSHA